MGSLPQRDKRIVETVCAQRMWANCLRGPRGTLRPRISDALGPTLPPNLAPPSPEDLAELLGRPAPRMLEQLLGPARRFLWSSLERAAAEGPGPVPVATRLGPRLTPATRGPAAASSAAA